MANLWWQDDMTERTCSVNDCNRPHYGRGFCAMHYQHWRKTGSADDPLKGIWKCGHLRTPETTIFEKGGKERCRPCREQYNATFVSETPCTVCGDPQLARDLCGKHYQRQVNKGSTDDPVYLTPEQRRQHLDDAMRRWRERNPGVEAERQRQKYAEDAVYREAERERRRRYVRDNPGKIAAYNRLWGEMNPEHKARLYREWVEANPERARDIYWNKTQRRRARERASTVGPVDRKRVIEDYGMICHLCTGEIKTRTDLHIDHVFPIAAGGPHVQDNLRPSHSWCNLRKGAKLLP